jgi:hypothetical protein
MLEKLVDDRRYTRIRTRIDIPFRKSQKNGQLADQLLQIRN